MLFLISAFFHITDTTKIKALICITVQMKLSELNGLRRKKKVMDYHFSSLFPAGIPQNCYGYYDLITKTI